MTRRDDPTLDEIEMLRASLQAHAADGNWCEDGARAIAALQRRCRDLEVDARRYRFLSDRMTHERAGNNFGYTLSEVLPGDDPDTAVDVAMKGKG